MIDNKIKFENRANSVTKINNMHELNYLIESNENKI